MITLNQSVQYLKGVGPARAEKLSRLGIATVGDLIEYFPRDWSDRRHCTLIAFLKPGMKTTVKGIVQRIAVQKINRSLGILHVFVRDSTGVVDAIWIRTMSRRYDVFESLTKKLSSSKEIVLFGTVDFFYRSLQFKVEDYEIIDTQTFPEVNINRIVPLYPLTEGLTQRFLRSLIFRVFSTMNVMMSDVLPPYILKKRNLLPRSSAIKEMHFPSSLKAVEHARQSLAYHEFFLIEYALMLKKLSMRKNRKEHEYCLKKHLLTSFKNNLGFSFTRAQKKVIREIFNDLMSPHPMNRLLQGDVGSGKTIVALSAMLLAAENNYQSALLAPTEILADQHFSTLIHFCRGLNIHIKLLKSGIGRQERDLILKHLQAGEISIIVGTHALLEPDVQFKNLKLLVVDEQHRFGVVQRARLRMKGNPDTLVMTATPIPRTLAMTVYGDLDVSVLDELPPGRKTITTLQVTELHGYEIIRAAVARRNQAYIVYPLIEESGAVELKSVLREWERLQKTVFASYRVGILHGRMPHHLKDATMREFAAGAYDILMTTTVIEVGIDVPNATVMLIQHADRFGLATLHQLRGRVGRGSEESWCLLEGDPSTQTSIERIKIMQETSDGFRISEEDLRLRGPGELLGTLQHGVPELKAGNLITDGAIIEQARQDAQDIITNHYASPDIKTLYEDIKKVIDQRFKKVLSLSSVG